MVKIFGDFGPFELDYVELYNITKGEATLVNIYFDLMTDNQKSTYKDVVYEILDKIMEELNGTIENRLRGIRISYGDTPPMICVGEFEDNLDFMLKICEE